MATATMEEAAPRVSEADVVEVLADPASLSTDRLEHQIVSQAAHLTAAMCRWLLLVAEYDRREAWGQWECRSMAHFLEWKCGIAITTAREHVRVARAIAELPLVREAFGRAELSYSKVRAITRVATPSTEKELVDLGTWMTGSQLTRAMHVLERAAREITAEELEVSYRHRYVDYFPTSSGWRWCLDVGHEEHAMLLKAIEMGRDADYRDAKAEGKAAAEAAGTSGPTPVPAGRGGRLPRIDSLMRVLEWGLTRVGELDDDELPSERYQIVLHQSGEVHVDGKGLVVLDNGMRLHPKTAQRLGCNATIRLVDGDGHDLDKGRRMRSFTRRQRRLLAQRYPRCGFPHCDIPVRWCDMHHVVPWEEGGVTDVSNGLPQCKKHHHAVHEGGWRLFRDAAGMVIAVGPDGKRVTESPAMPAVEDDFTLPGLHDQLGVNVKVDRYPRYERGNLREIMDFLILSYEGDYLRQKRELEEAAQAIPGGPPDFVTAGAGGAGAGGAGQRPLLN